MEPHSPAAAEVPLAPADVPPELLEPHAVSTSAVTTAAPASAVGRRPGWSTREGMCDMVLRSVAGAALVVTPITVADRKAQPIRDV